MTKREYDPQAIADAERAEIRDLEASDDIRDSEPVDDIDEAYTFAEIQAPAKHWDALADELRPHLEAAQQHALLAVRGSWAIGALICDFARREDVLREVERANHGRRGRPWIPENYVAARVAEVVGYSDRWMKACAQAYRKQVDAGLLPEGDIKAVLSWREDPNRCDPESVAADPARLLDTRSDEAPEEAEAPKVEALIQQTFAFMDRKFDRLIREAAQRRARISPKKLRPYIDQLNHRLDHLGLSIAFKA